MGVIPCVVAAALLGVRCIVTNGAMGAALGKERSELEGHDLLAISTRQAKSWFVVGAWPTQPQCPYTRLYRKTDPIPPKHPRTSHGWPDIRPAYQAAQ
jgi:hypothetical protein